MCGGGGVQLLSQVRLFATLSVCMLTGVSILGGGGKCGCECGCGGGCVCDSGRVSVCIDHGGGGNEVGKTWAKGDG